MLRFLFYTFSFLGVLWFSSPLFAQVSLDLRGNVGGSGIPGGSIVPGYDNSTCTSSIEGAIRYNSSSVTPAPSDYVHYWPMDETTGTTVTDNAGSSNGTWNGSAAVSYTDGVIGSALVFDGTDDHISIPDAATLEAQTNMSVSLWIKYDAASLGTEQIIFQKDHSAAPWLGWALGTSSSNFPYFYFAATDLSYWDVGPSIVFADQWYHFVGVKSGNDLQFYVNGARNEAFNDSPVTSTFFTSSDGPFGIGSDPSSTSTAFDGVLDDLRIFDRALSSVEVFELFEEGLRGGSSGTGCVEFCNGSSWVCP